MAIQAMNEEIPDFRAAWLFIFISALDSIVSMFVVWAKSAMGAFSFAGDVDLGESCKIIPPGPFGTAWNDFPKNLTDVGIPVDHALVISSNTVSVPVLCFCRDCNLPNIL